MEHNQPSALHIVDIQQISVSVIHLTFSFSTRLYISCRLGRVLIILALPLVPYDNAHNKNSINIDEQNE